LKKALIAVICVAVIVAAALVWRHRDQGEQTKPAGEAPTPESAEDVKVERDEAGNVVIKISDDTQGDMGLKVTNLAAASYSREIRGSGQVLDPTPLAALMAELASDQVAYEASSNDWVRLKTLAAQGNTSARALQAAEATALHDRLAIQSAKNRLVLAWGQALAEQQDPTGLIQELTSLNAILVRVDLPAGETFPGLPSGARLSTLSDGSAEGAFLSVAAAVDPLTQGRGYIFLVKPNALHWMAGEAVTGYLKLAGEPEQGVIIPREAVVRTEGSGWVYVLNGGAESYTRKRVELDHPSPGGWFVAGGLGATNYVVVAGAQELLSEELKPAGKPD
jgi:hypothetical protein